MHVHADGKVLLAEQEGQDLDDTIWNVSMAAGVCLGLVAMTVRDDIIPLVIAPFVQVRPRRCCRSDGS